MERAYFSPNFFGNFAESFAESFAVSFAESFAESFAGSFAESFAEKFAVSFAESFAETRFQTNSWNSLCDWLALLNSIFDWLRASISLKTSLRVMFWVLRSERRLKRKILRSMSEIEHWAFQWMLNEKFTDLTEDLPSKSNPDDAGRFTFFSRSCINRSLFLAKGS